ncbi:hypothetical protein MLD38_022730 [Melastoma candidum]|uniref:Uncharacterized protein n=1 Tax=Melastoma candidum TaxID=119954 RepID=A0ACB9QKE9_9MYRT|nr:hypothetical protein MLD38_022730 [Melastoma candidum]
MNTKLLVFCPLPTSLEIRAVDSGNKGRRYIMAGGDWGPVIMATVLFVVLSPGLLFQLPGKGRAIEFTNMQTSGVSILVHTILFFGFITIFVIAIRVHVSSG